MTLRHHLNVSVGHVTTDSSRPILSVPRVLISDDDRDLRESLSQVFVSQGFETVLTGDGRQAYEVVCQQNVHLVLIDFNMPRMSGLEAVRLIKQFDRRLPVILMSAELERAIAEQMISEDFFSVHEKPIDIGNIRKDVSRALHKIYNWTMDY